MNHDRWVHVIQSNSQLRIHVNKYLQLSRLPVPETATSLEATYDSSPPVIKVQVMQQPEWETSIKIAEKIRGEKNREMKMKKITSIASLLHLRFTRQTGIHSNKFCVNAVRFYSPPSSTKPPGKVSPLTNNYFNHWLKIQILRLYAW